MELNELRKSMSTLEQVLAKTDADISINVSASETAQVKILRKFRQGGIMCIVLAAIFALAAIVNINPLSFPRYLKVYMVILLVTGTVWYIFMYKRLKHINVGTLAPVELFRKTATLKMLMVSAEVFLSVGMVVFFALCLPHAWDFNRFGFWAVIIGLVAVTIYSVLHYYPKYIRLFRELNSIK